MTESWVHGVPGGFTTETRNHGMTRKGPEEWAGMFRGFRGSVLPWSAPRGFRSPTILLALLLMLVGCAGQHVYRRDAPQAHADGVAFLLSRQNRDGSFGSAANSHGFDVPVVCPDSYYAEQVSCTALTVMALRKPGLADPKVAAARERAIAYLESEKGKVYRAAAGELYNVWTHCYVVRALAEVLADEPSRAKSRSMLLWHLGMLEKQETMWGGWQYYDTFGAVHPAL